MNEPKYELIFTPYEQFDYDKFGLDFLLDSDENEELCTYADRIETFDEANKLLEQMKRYWQRENGWNTTFGLFAIVREDGLMIHSETTQEVPDPYGS